MKKIIILTIFLITTISIAQVEMNYEILNYMASQEPAPDPNNKTEIKKRFQTYFIKKVYLSNIFKSNHLFYSENNNQDYGLINELMMNKFADHLVETNFLDLSSISIDE